MNYDSLEHLHRYAVWTAARAQRAFMTNAQINKIIEKVFLKDAVFALNENCTAEEFDNWHYKTAHLILKEFQRIKSDVCFGRAAKVLNIYLKTTLVIPNCNRSFALVNNIHPPIDRILLKSLIKCNFLPPTLFTSWTNMSADEYYNIINALRIKFSILWQSEVCWAVSDEKEII